MRLGRDPKAIGVYAICRMNVFWFGKVDECSQKNRLLG